VGEKWSPGAAGYHRVDAHYSDEIGLVIEHTARLWGEIASGQLWYSATPYGSHTQVCVQATEYANADTSNLCMTIDGGGHLIGDEARLLIRQLRVAAKFIEEHEPVSKRAKASRKRWHDRESVRRDCAPAQSW
jgi:hypothetical protein